MLFIIKRTCSPWLYNHLISELSKSLEVSLLDVIILNTLVGKPGISATLCFPAVCLKSPHIFLLNPISNLLL